MASPSAKPETFGEIANDKTYLLQPWHHGEPERSWWLDLDRAGFTAQAKKEQTRIEASSMAIRITRKENT